MIRSAKARKKQSQDRWSLFGIVVLLTLFVGSYVFYQDVTDPLDGRNCSIKNGPTAITAIVFDKSQAYSPEQITDIKASFKSWLKGVEPSSKKRPIDLELFSVGTLLQLYVTDQGDLDQAKGLPPLVEMCIPKDSQKANEWIENEEFMKEIYDRFITAFNSQIELLLKVADGTSPIMETFVRISNSESFLAHQGVPRNLFVVSDMLQNSDNYSHYKENQGTDWTIFEKKMAATIYLRPRLNDVRWQVFFAKRDDPREKKLQSTRLSKFWESFFNNAGAKARPWILIDG